MSDLKERVEKLEENFQDLSAKKNRLDGQYQTIMDQLKELGCPSLEEAQKAIEEIQSDLAKEKKDLLVKIEELETCLEIKGDSE